MNNKKDALRWFIQNVDQPPVYTVWRKIFETKEKQNRQSINFTDVKILDLSRSHSDIYAGSLSGLV